MNVRSPAATPTVTVDLGTTSGDVHPASHFGPGDCLGRYVVLRPIGDGGMGRIYAAYDPELDRNVALKVLHRMHDRRLLREAQAAARLTHPNVITVYDVGMVAGRLFLAMQLVEGETLAAWLAAEPRSPRQILAAFEQAGQGLAAAHAAGIVHRDFKPSNVMVARDGQVLVLDFGLAYPLRPDAVAPAGEDGAQGAPAPAGRAGVGTPRFMAPEQLLGEPIDGRTDQFTFCVALHEALYGAHPFGGDPEEIRQRVLAGDPIEPTREPASGRARSSRVPAAGRRAIARGLAADRRDRHADMPALLEHLRRRPARRAWAAAAVLLLTLPAAVLLYRGSGAPDASLLCRGADRKLAGIWDGSLRRQLSDRFAADGSAATGVWPQLEAQLDDYADHWVDLHTRGCEATHLRGEQSPALLDLQVGCLFGRLQALRATTELLASGGPDTLTAAPKLIDALPPLASCADTEALLSQSPEPPDPAIVAQVDAVREELARVRALDAAGRWPEALELAERAHQSATALSYPPLLAEALLARAQPLARTGHPEAMRESLIAAVAAAHAAGHDRVAATALNQLLISAFALRDPASAEVWRPLAAAAIERLGNPPELAADHQLYLGMLANVTGDWEASLRHHRAARELDPVLRPIRRAVIANNLAVAYRNLERPDDAERSLQEALSLLEASYGPQHPQVAGPLLNLGDLEVDRGRFERALLYLRRALELSRGDQARGLRAEPLALVGIGRCEVELGRPRPAVAALEEALALIDPEREAAPMASARFQLARALAADGQSGERGRSLARQALAGWRQLGPRFAADAEAAERWLARH